MSRCYDYELCIEEALLSWTDSRMESIHRRCLSLVFLLAVILYDHGFLVQASPAGFHFLSVPFQLETVGLGSNFLINCATNGTNVTTSLYHRPLIGSWTQVTKENRDVIVNGHVYSIVGVKRQDEGYYKCRATNGNGQTIEWPLDSGLLVPSSLLPPDLTISPPALRVGVREGDSKNLTCTSHGKRISLTWYKTMVKGTFLVPKKKTVTIRDNTKNAVQAVLVIKNARPRDSGYYKCVLQFGGQQRFQYTRLLVYEKQTPTILRHSKLVNVSNLQKAKLKCIIKSRRRPKFKWFKGDKEIQVPGCDLNISLRCKSLKYSLVLKYNARRKRYRSILVVSSAIYPDDQGMYRCVVSNDQGTATADTRVGVLVKPVLLKAPAHIVYRQQRKKVVSCRVARANPPPTFTWEMQLVWGSNPKPHPNYWVPLRRGHTVKQSKDRKSSTIAVPPYVIQSFYRCTAANIVGKDAYLIKYQRR